MNVVTVPFSPSSSPKTVVQNLIRQSRDLGGGVTSSDKPQNKTGVGKNGDFWSCRRNISETVEKYGSDYY